MIGVRQYLAKHLFELLSICAKSNLCFAASQSKKTFRESVQIIDLQGIMGGRKEDRSRASTLWKGRDFTEEGDLPRKYDWPVQSNTKGEEKTGMAELGRSLACWCDVWGKYLSDQPGRQAAPDQI